MQLTAQQVFDATLTLTTIINEKRPMPQLGKYHLARLHSKLLPEFNLLATQRDALIDAYDHYEPIGTDGDGNPLLATTHSVPADKVGEFNAAWKAIADTAMWIEVDPIPIQCLSLAGDANGSIEAHELVTLGNFVSD